MTLQIGFYSNVGLNGDGGAGVFRCSRPGRVSPVAPCLHRGRALIANNPRFSLTVTGRRHAVYRRIKVEHL